ncbi:MAG: pectate lyase [Bacteroidales bacterium]|nr:pectate lyase [Bacteroidales bacterium]
MNNKRIKPAYLILLVCILLSAFSADAINLRKQGAWYESAYATWEEIEGAHSYQVFYSGVGLADVPVDDPLIRRYPDEYRVDVPGLEPGAYTLRIVALNEKQEELAQCTTELLEVKAFRREGFAFTEGVVPGAYQSNGRLKDGVKILYVSHENINQVSCEVSDGKKKVMYTGLGNILTAYSKGRDKTPLLIRVIGCIKAADFEGLKDGNYLNFQGNNNSDRMLENITLEGIGNDATLHGFGVCFKRTKGIEVRNLGIMLFGDDGISMDTDNYHNWIHHNDIFYGATGSDADQVKGDGSIDLKYRSTRINIDYNHFFDSGKVMGCGGATKEEVNLLLSFHHNWFDHTDSRCPRLNHSTAHIYNNYYDGVSVYGIGCTEVSNAFIEANHFRNCQRPMMIAGQGTDRIYASNPDKGTFSGQTGGMSKAFNNKVEGDIEIRLLYQTDNAEQYDAWLVSSREEKLPETAKAYKGGWVYDNFDTSEDMYVSHPDAPEEVADIVTQSAGRLEGGDIKWTFDNEKDDRNHDLNTALKNVLLSYQSRLMAIQGISSPSTALAAPCINETQAIYFDLQGRSIAEPEKGVYLMKQGNKYIKRMK